MININKIRNNLLIHRDITEKWNFKRLEELTKYLDKIMLCLKALETIDSTIKTIKLDEKVHTRLLKHRTIKETYQDVIIKLLDFYEERNKI